MLNGDFNAEGPEFAEVSQRREESGEGEGDGVVGGRNASDSLGASMEYGSRDSYQLSIVFVFTQ